MRMTKILAAAWLCQTSMGFVSREIIGKRTTAALASRRTFLNFSSSLSPPFSNNARGTTSAISTSTRLFSTSTDSANLGIYRLETLLTMLSSHGAPGSIGCSAPDGDLEPVYFDIPGVGSKDENEKQNNDDEIPELITTLSDNKQVVDDEYANLHPHLFPLAKSKSTGNLICALRRAFAGDASDLYENSSNAQWPIVEAQIGGPGMRLLALNSEHLMRRIACECDSTGSRPHLIGLYNTDLGKDIVKDELLDRPYEEGAVDQLGYGVDKYVLLRVGPFPDIYRSLARGHAERKDESSALIAAESCNGKISGFASTFLFYSRLLDSLPNRSEERRDAARICLRMPLPSIGLATDEFREAAVLGEIANKNDSDAEVFAKLKDMYEKYRDHENNDDPRAGNNDMTPEQKAIDEANYIIDTTALTGSNWAKVRPQIADIYKAVGRIDMANFVCPSAHN